MAEQKSTQVVVVGGGPGGYAAAFAAADLGLDVTLVDAAENPGGVCLYRGCIPSKALLHVAKVLEDAKQASEWGVEFAPPTIHIDRVREWKNQVVGQLTSGLGGLTRQRKIEYVQGWARFADAHTLLVDRAEGGQAEIRFEHAILATGSRPATLPAHLTVDSPRVMDSTAALELEEVPETLLVVGGGYIGLELGTVYASLGSRVTVVEMMPTLLPGADRDLVSVLQRSLNKRFEKIMLETSVAGMTEVEGGIKVRFEGKEAGEQTFDRVLVAIGRRPNTENLGLENTKVRINEKGFIEVDEQRRTAEPSIFAIGDVAGEPMLAHKASYEGRIAAEVIAGKRVVYDPQAIPAVVFTDPEVAWCGLTEQEAKAQGRKVQVARFPWAASGRALTLGRTDGVTKIICDPETERVLGVAICGPGAGELIAEAVLAIEMGAVAEDLALTIHAHPTLSETVMESAQAVFGQATHIYRPRRG